MIGWVGNDLANLDLSLGGYSDASGEIEGFIDATFCFCPRSLDMEHSFRCPFLFAQGARFL